MNIKTKAFAKGGIATAAVGAMALAGATPAYAGDRDDDGISRHLAFSALTNISLSHHLHLITQKQP